MSRGYSRRTFVELSATAGALAATGALAGCIADPDVTETEGAGETETDGEGATTSTEDGGGTATEGGGGGGTTVAAGPNGELVFDPEEVTIGVGETVTWEFESPGHNVSAVPEDSDEVSIPDGAEPFATYESGNEFDTVPEGETFEHTFETAGTYTYVCVPHVSAGMIGTVVVE